MTTPCAMRRAPSGVVHFRWRVSTKFIDPMDGTPRKASQAPVIHAAAPCVGHRYHFFLACGERLVTAADMRRHRADAPVTCKNCLGAYARNYRWL